MQEPSISPLSLHAAAGRSVRHAGQPASLARKGTVRRRRLWELPAACHCPVIGVCLPMDVLRRLAGKALGGEILADDHTLHAGAVAEARSRNRLSKLLQQELEQRHARLVRGFQAARTSEEVRQQWQRALEEDDMAAAFWAALTHPQADPALQESLCRDMHMLQHQAGAQVRAHRDKCRTLLEENALLARELGRVQQRCTRMLAEKSADNQRLQDEVGQLRTAHARQAGLLAQQERELLVLRQAVPALDSRRRLQERLDGMRRRQHADAARIQALLQELGQLRHELASRPAPACPAAAELGQPLPALSAEEPALAQQTVLCVGGRNASLSGYRELIEQTGGRFAHHDGGLEHNCALLDTSLAAADLVICQTGCISHNAYWRVKDFCKRTGKRCVFVANPSVSSLARSLEQARVLPAAVLEEGGAAPAALSPESGKGR